MKRYHTELDKVIMQTAKEFIIFKLKCVIERRSLYKCSGSHGFIPERVYIIVWESQNDIFKLSHTVNWYLQRQIWRNGGCTKKWICLILEALKRQHFVNIAAIKLTYFDQACWGKSKVSNS